MKRLRVNGIFVQVDEKGSPDSPVVVLANSLAADMTMWAKQAEVLAENYRVVRFDARGHGQTEATAGDYTLDLLADDALRLLDVLDIERMNFVGLSLGGMIGQVLAARAPDRVESLVLCATFASAPSDLWNERVLAARSTGIGPMVEATVDRWLTLGFRAAHPDVTDAVRQMVGRTSPQGYAGCAAAIRDMNLEGVAEMISVPTLLIAAAQDISATPESMQALGERIDGARFALLEDAAHLFTMEQPDRATRLIAEFLDELGGLELETGGSEQTVR
ncbi:3-oxoadipate enol-lactonase [Mesorhizobium sp. A623]